MLRARALNSLPWYKIRQIVLKNKVVREGHQERKKHPGSFEAMASTELRRSTKNLSCSFWSLHKGRNTKTLLRSPGLEIPKKSSPWSGISNPRASLDQQEKNFSDVWALPV